MSAITVKVIEDTATPALRELMESLTPARLAARIGPALQRLTEQRLEALGPNKNGWPSTGFYKKFGRNVRWEQQENGVAVTILSANIHGREVTLAQRIYGGVIAPVSAQALAIPISPLSYGHLPSDFPNLFVLKTPNGAFLAQRNSDSAKKSTPALGRSRASGTVGANSDNEVTFLFKLSSGVSQDGNVNILPKEEDYLAAATQAVMSAGRN